MVETMEIQKDFKQPEVGVIPEDWEVKKLSEIGESIIGLTYSPSNVKSTGTLVLRSSNVQNGKLAFKDNVFVEMDLPKRVIVKENDILICVRNGSRQLIGKCALIDKETAGSAFGAFMSIYRSEFSVFAFHQFQSYSIQRQINETLGATINQITNRDLAAFQIPLPPTKAEQTAIATALNDADALITQLEKLIAKKQAIKQGAMQELLKPKDGWEVKNLGQIADIRRGASPRPIKDPKWFSDSGRGWIRISDVTSSNVYLNSTTQYLSEDGARNSVAVNRGDLIMSICATIGIPIIINIPACIHDGFVLFQNYEKELDTFFLYFCLQVKTEILTGKGQPGTQKNLNTTIVGDIEIDYPDVDEQRKIGLILRNIDIEISGLENKLNKYKMIKQGMMQNLLTGRIRLV